MMMTMRQAIKSAVTERNATLAGQVADKLRFRYGMNYEESLEVVQAVVPVDRADWDALLYAADEGWDTP
jgi:hypothetical protein